MLGARDRLQGIQSITLNAGIDVMRLRDRHIYILPEGAVLNYETRGYIHVSARSG